jgi:O-antigen chain-terminating methyltransferase
MTRMATPVMRRLMTAALRQPRVKRAARVLLSRIPGLQSRLRSLLYSNAWAMHSGATPPEPMIGNEAPARTARIFRELKQAQQARKDRCE